MDITADTFSYHLPRLLDELATACFVSIDCEFSGISTISQGPSRVTSLQERYEDVKRSADKYRIVQIGLTICHENPEKATYTLKPFNLYLSPIIDRKLDVERDLCFQSSAVEFLLENKFCMTSLYTEGVYYLSREEETKAIAKGNERNIRSARATMDVKESEHESIEFLKAVRRLVDEWCAIGDAREPYLNIPPPSRASVVKISKSMPSTLNRFQKRLVHQLIEVEYPSLVTISQPAFIQIIDYNEDREKAVQDQRMKRTQERVWKQIGFRWVAEALAGGDLSNFDPYYFRSIMSTAGAVEPQDSLKEFSNKMKQQLQSHRPVLVGHNLFTDLIYFYRSFFGPLPDSVEEFQALAHGLFPVLIDTKYMATHDCGSITPRSSLSEINESLLKISTPEINVHHQHSKYKKREMVHEAGYDSLLTAQVFIKLAAQLRDGGTSKLPKTVSGPSHDQSSGVTKQESPIKPTEPKPEQNSPKTERVRASGLRSKFDVLDIEEDTDKVDSRARRSPAISEAEMMQKVNNGELIPRTGAGFWKVYSNKMRVFGTVERVCVMD